MRLKRMTAMILLCCLIGIAAAADEPGASDDDARAKAISVQLSSGKREDVTQAIGEVNSLMESDPDASVGLCRKYWLPALLSSSKDEVADRLAFDAILAAPWQTGSVEFLQETHVQIMLRSHQPSEALSAAHSLFNVASLHGTEHALIVVVECLKAVRGEDNAMLRRFRNEQLAGATTRPVTQIEPTSAMVTQIAIDPSPYATAISQFVSDDDQSRKAKGNLLLLAGRCDEAKTAFETMSRQSDSSDRIGLAENVARAIKASDGTIGRANGYMLSQPDTLKSK